MLRPAEEEDDEAAFKEAAEAEAERPPLFSEAAADCDERSRCLAAPVDDIFSLRLQANIHSQTFA